MARTPAENLYVGRSNSLLGLPNIPETPVANIARTLQVRVRDIIACKGHGQFSMLEDIQIPSDYRAFDLQTLMTDSGFLPFANPALDEELVKARAFCDVDLIKPLNFYVPEPSRGRKLFQYPAISIDAIGDDLNLRFGHLIEANGVWSLGKITDPRITELSPVTYFKSDARYKVGGA